MFNDPPPSSIVATDSLGVVSTISAPNGIPYLDESGRIPPHLTYSGSVITQYSDRAAFPAVGSINILYVDQATTVVYRYTGSAYIPLDDNSPYALGTDLTAETTARMTADAVNLQSTRDYTDGAIDALRTETDDIVSTLVPYVGASRSLDLGTQPMSVQTITNLQTINAFSPVLQEKFTITSTGATAYTVTTTMPNVTHWTVIIETASGSNVYRSWQYVRDTIRALTESYNNNTRILTLANFNGASFATGARMHVTFYG